MSQRPPRQQREQGTCHRSPASGEGNAGPGGPRPRAAMKDPSGAKHPSAHLLARKESSRQPYRPPHGLKARRAGKRGVTGACCVPVLFRCGSAGHSGQVFMVDRSITISRARKQKPGNRSEGAEAHRPLGSTAGTQAQPGYSPVSKAVLEPAIILPPPP